MKRFVKIIFPPIIAFWAFAVLIKFAPFVKQFNSSVSQIGQDSIYGLVSYYKVFAPFQILIAVLTQWLIIMPLWDKIVARPKASILIYIGFVLICFAAAFGIAYAIWDNTTGTKKLMDNWLFMTAVQLFYWVINFLILCLIDWKALRNAEIESDKETETES